MTDTKVNAAAAVTLSANKANRLDASSQRVFIMPTQAMSNWCWIACATATGNYYYTDRTYTQCQVANACLNRSDCCDVPKPDACNQTGSLETSLKSVECFNTRSSVPASWEIITKQLSLARPIGVRVKWTGTDRGHVMMITGYNQTQSPMIEIADPWYGSSNMRYSQFPAYYQEGGSWTHSYYTKQQGGEDEL